MEKGKIDNTINIEGTIFKIPNRKTEEIKLPTENENEYEYLFWQFLRYLDVHTKSDDILIRRDIADGYKLWNKLHGTNLKPETT